MAKNKTLLLVELIPSTCHYSNVRTTVTPQEWDKIRFISYAAAGNRCEICGEIGKDQGYKHNLECHEIWEYNDETHVQRLAGLIALCPVCHHVKHIGRSQRIGKEKECYDQMAKVNGWTLIDIQNHLIASFELHRERSKHEWDLDLSILTEAPYELKIKDGMKRKFVKKKYKKKRKKTTNKKAAKKAAFKRGTKRPPKKK